MPKPGTVTVQVRPQIFADGAFVKDHLNDPNVTIVDARSKVYYDGRPTGQPKTGHIRGAVSVPYSEVVDSLARFKSPEELRTLFEEAGVKKGSTVVTYCHVGQQATATLLAARLLGYDVRMYDGSFEDWSYQDGSFPVETPKKED
jgi:thiosulfate/3-mercaptopyruvate sulfurtransferase